jgi:hypothetical protein
MTTTEPRPMMPLVECTPWCKYGDGHPNQWCREDQACWSPDTYVDLSLHPVHREESGDYPEQIGVMVQRNHERTVVYLHLTDIKIRGPQPPHDFLDHSLHLTPDEAESLAALLIENAKLVRSDGTDPV